MKKWISLIGAVLLPACLSCLFGTDTGDGEQYDQTTVLGTLNLFIDVWNSGDVNAYEGLLDEESFTFYFDSADVWGDIPFSWGYDAEMRMYEKLFSQVGAANVSAQLDLSGVSEPGEGADTCALEDIAYLLYVCMPDLDTVLKADGRLDLQLEKIGGAWVVTKWWDNANSRLAGICECTWGGLKGEFMGGGDD